MIHKPIAIENKNLPPENKNIWWNLIVLNTVQGAQSPKDAW